MEATKLEEKTEKQKEKERVINQAFDSIKRDIEMFSNPETRNEVIMGELKLLYSFGNLHGYCEGLTAGATLQKVDTESKEISEAEKAWGIGS